jgi:ribonuclease E
MTKRMLIDGTHAEETRVVVLDGNRLEDFDVETSTKKQLKGNIYLAKIVRVEPSLQAAFVEYGASRHGFLAFGEIHPDYYQIPVADRQRLIAQQEQEAREAEAEEDAAALAEGDPNADVAQSAAPGDTDEPLTERTADHVVEAGSKEPPTGSGLGLAEVPPEPGLAEWPVEAPAQPAVIVAERVFETGAFSPSDAADEPGGYDTSPVAALAALGLEVGEDGQITGDPQAMEQLQEALDGTPDVGGEPAAEVETDTESPSNIETVAAAPPPETIGGHAETGDEPERRQPSRYLRSYKIQEVIRRRQIMLVQVVKEERGGKGAALTTYISLAGRFCVLMPNSPRGGGISRKITSAADRRRLKEITTELAIPSGMGLIVRTAGAARPKPEIRRDCEYLLQLWDDIRDTTMKSEAPAAIYEEASLIKRAIRDVYSRDVDEVMVDGEAAWHAARDQMRLLMPSHAHKVQLWHDPAGTPLFAHHQVDIQLDAMLSPTVQLRSGGYLVIDQTEALVAVDVNSGRSTRERGIEETALRTNLEASEELARQLRLRDLAGLIVIDFIDMEQKRHNAMVERKLKEALANDRARIQLGTISHFGLMEMSRQRLRPSLAETSFVQCPQCGGTGHVRSTEGASIHVLRAIEEEGGKRRSAEIMVNVAGPVAMYILNHKRDRLREIETRTGMTVLFTPDPTLLPPAVKIERLRAMAPGEGPPPTVAIRPTAPMAAIEDDSVELEEDDEVAPAEAVAAPRQASVPEAARAAGETGEASRRRRRRRRRGGRREDGPRAEGEEDGLPAIAQPDAEQPDLGGQREPGEADHAAADAMVASAANEAPMGHAAELPGEADGAAGSESADTPARRRGRRGGRRRRKDGGFEEAAAVAAVPEPIGYTGPTPADPFGGGIPFDIFDALEQAEARAGAPLMVAAPVAVAAPEPEVLAAAVEVPVAVEAPAEVEVAAPRPVRARSRRAAAAAAPELALAPVETPVAAPEPASAPPAEAVAAPDPLIRPVLVDQAPPPAPRQGWWRR